MNNAGEINEDDKMAKHTIFFMFICLYKKTKKRKKMRFEGKYVGITFSKWLQKADDWILST